MEQLCYPVIAGAGSAGLTWNEVARELGAVVLPIPDEPSAPAMAAALESAISALPRPRVLIGASMGAIVALEVVRNVEVDALVLVAAGHGIDVSDRLLDWMSSNPPGITEKMARICVADKDDQARIDAIVEDYTAAGQDVHVRHLQALAGYRPEPLLDPLPDDRPLGRPRPGRPSRRARRARAKMSRRAGADRGRGPCAVSRAASRDARVDPQGGRPRPGSAVGLARVGGRAGA